MKLGFYIIMDNGNLFGPIASDNPKWDTYLDPRIENKVAMWAKRLKQEWKFVGNN